ncbi:Glycosyl transferase family 2 [Cetobacterium ceti]|uniref:Glycosyl transferase family 2 n=1 Tax=Cetobacterium ceti TaxID=180163 RepID=A0A1T4LSZ1_9FUSO|nr:glycosyltransferase family 2 protein [Cetobacterium ceti]SJZ57849.1 Glycosyl transferase family 2 [Cetobacterium ceti]
MKKTDKLTIIIPTYERIEFFEEAYLSVLNQTIVPKIMVIDNGSKHNEFNHIITKYSYNDVKYIKNKENIGMFANWNKGIKLSTTEFFMILGDDDKLENTYVERFLKAEEENKLDIYYTNFMCLVRNKKINNKEKLKILKKEKGKKLLELAAKDGMTFPIISSCIRKSKFKEFYAKSHGSNDWLWIYSKTENLNIYGDEMIGLLYRRHLKNDSLINTLYTRYSKIAIYYIIYIKLLKNKKYIYAYLAYLRGFLEYCIMNTSSNFLIAEKYNLKNRSIYYRIIKKGYVKNFPFMLKLYKYKIIIFFNKTFKRYKGV